MSDDLIALIHDGNAARLAHVRPAIAELAQRMPSSTTIEISHQMPAVAFGRWRSLCRAVDAVLMIRRWARYRRAPAPPLARLLAGEIMRGVSARGRRLAATEVNVSDKHARAWLAAIDSGARTLLVLEDDAVFPDGAVAALAAGLARLAPPPPEGRYLDVAGGLPMSDLGVEGLVVDRREGLTTFSRAVTNTTCGYLLDRALLLRLHAGLVRNPRYRRIASDWMINLLLMDMQAEGRPVAGAHFEPPLLRHGSIAGAYPSLVR